MKHVAVAIGESIENGYARAVEHEKTLRATVRDQKMKLIEVDGIMKEFRTLLRAIEAASATYERLLDRINDKEVTEAVDETVVRTFSEPLLPTKPVSPKKTITVAAAGVFGTMFGLALVIAMGLLDRTLHSRKQVESTLGLAVLAEVPRAFDKDRDLGESLFVTRDPSSLVKSRLHPTTSARWRRLPEFSSRLRIRQRIPRHSGRISSVVARPIAQKTREIGGSKRIHWARSRAAVTMRRSTTKAPASGGEYWHPAHLLVFEAVKEAVARLEEDAPTWLTFSARQPDYPLPELVNWDDPAFLTFDGTRHERTRLRALNCHRTQLGLFSKFASGEHDDFIRLTAREAYALPYRGRSLAASKIAEAADEGEGERDHRGEG